MTSSEEVLVRRRQTPKQRQQLPARFHQSQMTLKGFAARHSIGLSTLSKWLHQERLAHDPAHLEKRTGCLLDIRKLVSAAR